MKRIFYIIVCGMLNLAAGAQNLQLPGLQLSSNQQLIEDAVKDGLFVIRQNYQIKDTSTTPPTYYRWGNDPHLGTVYALGIKVRGGFYGDNRILFPWNSDTRYEEYRNIANYVPVISETNWRSPDSTHYGTAPFSADSCTLHSDSLAVHVKSAMFAGRGFNENYSPGEKDGWLVWAVSDKPLPAADTLPLSLLIYRTKLVYEAGKKRYEIKNPATDKEILGGLYIVPETGDIGQIIFKLSGILIKIDSKWNVAVLDPNTAASALQSVRSGRLTPVTPAGTQATPAGTQAAPAGTQDSADKKKRKKK
ncbi:MAG: hypothetical protein LBS43_00745 [Prevotellaceae bacterium]|jgi:hypothetical protein|nr:hypothetical protein [Prevotellaceae bacterium]